jgi:hypothetical protein
MERKRKIIVGIVVICTSDELMMDTKKTNLSEFISIGVAIFHATIEKSRADEHEVKCMRKEI